MIGRRANVAHAQHLISRRGSGFLQLCAKTGANLKRNFRRLCLCKLVPDGVEAAPLSASPANTPDLLFNNLSESSVALRVVALVGLTAAAPTARPPSPACSIEGRLVQGGPGLPASSDCCGKPPAAALRLPAISNINETNNGRNIGSSPFTGGIADLPSKQEVVCRLPDSGLPIIA